MLGARRRTQSKTFAIRVLLAVLLPMAIEALTLLGDEHQVVVAQRHVRHKHLPAIRPATLLHGAAGRSPAEHLTERGKASQVTCQDSPRSAERKVSTRTLPAWSRARIDTFAPPPSISTWGSTRWSRLPPLTRTFLMLSCLGWKEAEGCGQTLWGVRGSSPHTARRTASTPHLEASFLHW